MTGLPCIVEEYGRKRACGSASTYNNARCRGDACTQASAKCRADYRARKRKPIEERTVEPEENP